MPSSGTPPETDARELTADGAALFITERTARTYVSNILGKLGLASRTQAALYAVEHKLVDPPK